MHSRLYPTEALTLRQVEGPAEDALEDVVRREVWVDGELPVLLLAAARDPLGAHAHGLAVVLEQGRGRRRRRGRGHVIVS